MDASGPTVTAVCPELDLTRGPQEACEEREAGPVLSLCPAPLPLVPAEREGLKDAWVTFFSDTSLSSTWGMTCLHSISERGD